MSYMSEREKRRAAGVYWDAPWNVVTGCSMGCPYCWAQPEVAYRFANNPVLKHRDRYIDFKPATWPERLNVNFRKTPTIYFTALYGDLFGPEIEEEFIFKVFDKMTTHSRHIFLVCTKQAERMEHILYRYPGVISTGSIAQHIWLGVSITDTPGYNKNWPFLHNSPVGSNGVRWLSYEPVLGPVRLHDDIVGPDLVVMGAQTGRDASRSAPKFATFRKMRTDCRERGIAFWLKSMRAGNTISRRMLDGRVHSELPTCEFCDRCGKADDDENYCEIANPPLGRCGNWRSRSREDE